jgi:endonuclease/exonuclease/phosphatase family metal-dependent hydrolase
MTTRPATVLCWSFAAIWALWALIRLTGLEAGYPLVPLIAYTPYMAVAAVVPIAIGVGFRRWGAVVLSAVAGLYLAFAVLPRVIPDGEASEPLGGPTVNVVSANIFRGQANLRDLVHLVRVRDADVLSVQELTPKGARELRRVGIAEVLPHAVFATREGAYGGGIYSRLPLRRLPPVPGTTFRMPRASVMVRGYGPLRIVGVHPFPPNSSKGLGDWRAGLHSLPSAEGGGAPWVLAGDFNATLDHAELQRVLSHGYRDAADVRGDGLQMTWSARRSIPPPVAIDHVLVDRRLSVLEFGVDDLPGSDHRAIHARLSLPGAGERPSD